MHVLHTMHTILWTNVCHMMPVIKSLVLPDFSIQIFWVQLQHIPNVSSSKSRTRIGSCGLLIAEMALYNAHVLQQRKASIFHVPRYDNPGYDAFGLWSITPRQYIIGSRRLEWTGSSGREPITQWHGVIVENGALNHTAVKPQYLRPGIWFDAT
jgi:hypothetical protein